MFTPFSKPYDPRSLEVQGEHSGLTFIYSMIPGNQEISNVAIFLVDSYGWRNVTPICSLDFKAKAFSALLDWEIFTNKQAIKNERQKDGANRV